MRYVNALDVKCTQNSHEWQQIKMWFHNHTRGSTSGLGTQGVLKITQLRLCQEWQVYQMMAYESKWKTIINSEWEAYKKKWDEENPGVKVPQGHFAFMNLFLKNKYAEEMEEVKAVIRKRRAAMKVELNAETNEQNNAYQT